MSFEATRLTPLIQVYDMPESVRFYCSTLGFEVASSSPEVDTPEGRMFHWAWLRLGGANLMLNTAYDEGERPSARDPERLAGHRDIGLFIACADVDAIYRELSAKGLELRPPQAAPYGMKQLFLEDPDGYCLSFQQPA
ncbi:MAG: VOC family protein [Sphingosinicella sp.]